MSVLSVLNSFYLLLGFKLAGRLLAHRIFIEEGRDYWKLLRRIPWINCIKFALWSCRSFEVTMYSFVALKTNSTILDFSLLTRLSENGIATMCEWHTFWWIFQVFRKWKCQNRSKRCELFPVWYAWDLCLVIDQSVLTPTWLFIEFYR